MDEVGPATNDRTTSGEQTGRAGPSSAGRLEAPFQLAARTPATSASRHQKAARGGFDGLVA
jgi:hypothetical protein